MNRRTRAIDPNGIGATRRKAGQNPRRQYLTNKPQEVLK